MAGRQLTLGDLVYRLGFENEEQFLRELDRLFQRGEDEAGKGGREAGRSWGEQFRATLTGSAIGSFIGGFMSQAFARAVDAARDFAVASVREFAVYEQGLLQLKLAGEQNLGAVEARIDGLARASRVFSRTDISVAIGGLVKAGYDVETAFALAEAAVLGAASEVDPATLKFGDLGDTAVQLGNILRALNYDTSQTGRVMDVMAKAAQDSNLDVSDLVDILARVGPTARLAGLEIEDVAAMAAVLSNNGMDASLISTGLRSVLQSLINPTGDVKDVLDRLGVSIVDKNGKIRDFNDVLDGLNRLTSAGGRGLQVLTEAVGSYGSTAASSLGQSSEAVKEFRTELENAEGSAKLLADTMRDSGAGAAAELQARLADARVELGTQLTPVLVDLYETVFPALVSGLAEVIALWQDWYFLINGTTPALERAQEQFESQFTPEQLATLDVIKLMRERRSGLVAERDRLVAAGASPEELAAIDAEIARVEAGIERMEAKYRELRGEAETTGRAVTGVATATNDVADANFNLNTAVKERPKDPLVDEAGRVQRDLRRLKLAFEQDLISREWYEEQLKAHLRRLDGLLDRATTTEQSAAILGARSALLKDLGAVTPTGGPSAAAGIREDPAMDMAARARQSDLQQMLREADEALAAADEQRRVHEGLAQAAIESAAAFDDQLRAEREAADALQRDADARRLVRDRQAQALSATLTEALSSGNTALMREALKELEAFSDRFGEAWAQRLFGDQKAQLEREIAAFEATMARAGDLDDAIRADVEAARALQDGANAQRLVRDRQAGTLAQSIAAALDSGNTALMREALADLDAFAQRFGEAWAEALFGAQQAELERRITAFEAAMARAADLDQRLASEREETEALQAAVDAERQVRERQAGRVTGLVETARTTQTAEDIREALAAIETFRDRFGEAWAEAFAAHERYLQRLLAATEAAAERSDRIKFNDFTVNAPERAAVLAQLAKDLEQAGEMAELMGDELGGAESKIRLTEAAIQTLVALGLNPASATIQALTADILQWKEAIDEANDSARRDRELKSQADQLADRVIGIAEAFPRAIADGIRGGDIGSALQQALGSAADFFLEQMLDAILGPIKQQLAATFAESLAASGGGAGAGLGALGTPGLVLGGVALLASLLIGAGQARARQAETARRDVQRTVSSAPSVTYNLSATVQLAQAPSFGDPSFEARLRAFVEQVAVDLFRRVQRSSS